MPKTVCIYYAEFEWHGSHRIIISVTILWSKPLSKKTDPVIVNFTVYTFRYKYIVSYW